MPHHDKLKKLDEDFRNKKHGDQMAIRFGTTDKPVMDRLSFYNEEKLKAENP
jgi:hypothetical protein